MHRQWGGQPNRVLTTAKGLRDRGHEVVVSGPRGCELVKRARAAGFEIFDDIELRSGLRPRSLLADIHALRGHYLQKQYDILDTHGSQDTWRTFVALMKWPADVKKPAFIRSRHNIFPVSGNPMNRWLYSHIDHVITVSPQVIPFLSSVMKPEDCTSIYSAPDFSRLELGSEEADAAARREVRAELGIPEDAPVVGVVARLAPEKGHRYLVEAAPAIAAQVPGVHFIFAGQGRSRADLEMQIDGLGKDLADRFHILGFRTDVPRVLRAFDLFVLPSTEGESLGTSILEGFVSGLPVVACDIGGVSESVVHEETGLLVPPADSYALEQAVVRLLQDRQLATRLMRAGQERVRRYFTPEAIAQQTEAVYQRVLENRSR